MSTASAQPPPLGPPSILDGLGHEVVAVVAPVSLCIAATVALVRTLNPDGGAGGAGIYWASAAYQEQVGGGGGRSGAHRGPTAAAAAALDRATRMSHNARIVVMDGVLSGRVATHLFRGGGAASTLPRPPALASSRPVTAMPRSWWAAWRMQRFLWGSSPR